MGADEEVKPEPEWVRLEREVRELEEQWKQPPFQPKPQQEPPPKARKLRGGTEP